MDEDLISKKDLLEETGISYGQLYRWKRKNLIPENWFIRKSTFTGQETFFPRARILERIARIQSMKENLSLDELAKMFSPGGGKLAGREEIIKRGIASEYVMNFYLEQTNTAEHSFSFEEILMVYILEKLLHAGEINIEEGKMILRLLQATNGKAIYTDETQLWIIRKLGISSCFLANKAEEIVFEKDTKVVAKIDFMHVSEELKINFL
ncbi:YhbD family protein [Heyndrickxia acidiproducens]|uniref:YhbD family protein n=1 Tax=Heyndrickxia acidiproducens TaxID=1121084 RepID=UPI000378F44B|nr:YhbD family protein [Heyndrickxia acidiproducens]